MVIKYKNILPRLSSVIFLGWIFMFLYPVIFKVFNDFLVGDFFNKAVNEWVYHLSFISSYSKGKLATAFIVGIISTAFYLLSYKSNKTRKLKVIVSWACYFLIYILWISEIGVSKPKYNVFLSIKNYDYADSVKIWQFGFWKNKKIENEQSFFKMVNNEFLRRKDFYLSYFKTEDEKLAKVFYLTNVVSALWGYGYLDESKSGCAQDYYINQNNKKKFPAYISDYLKTPIACCSDYAVLLEFLFSELRYESRISLIPSWHVFNEVKVNQDWFTVDANTNIVAKGSYENILNRKYGAYPNVYVFAHTNLKNKNTPNYRPGVKGFRTDFLHWMNNRKFKNFARLHKKEDYLLRRQLLEQK